MPNLLLAQTDFSGGQVNNGSRRRDDSPMVRSGAAIMKNWRCTSTKQLVPRPGRRTLFRAQGGRTQRFRMAQDVEVLLSFAAGAVAITTLDGTPAHQTDGTLAAAASPVYLWTDATLAQIYAVQARNDIVIAYPGMRPQILRWQRDSDTWSFLQFSFATVGNQVYEPFYRFSVPGATMSYDAVSGLNINLVCSQPFFTAAQAGSVLSIVGQQATIVQAISPTQAVASVGYRLPDVIQVPVADISPFLPGQVVANTGPPNYKFEVGSITPTTGTAGIVAGVLLSTIIYPSVELPASGDQLTSPIGSSLTTGTPSKGTLPIPTQVWQEEFMSDLRGWPGACFYDQGRLGFCDFPQLGEAILWGSINKSDSFWIDSQAAALQPQAGASADSAMLELIAQRPRVRHVVGWGDEFVFTDRGIYQIPVSTSNPLEPGSVEFRQFSNDGVSGIPPITTQDAIIYINAGQRRCSAVKATGSYTRPYVSEDLSDDHSDLFNAPYAMAIATGDGQHPERYVYLVMADNSVVIGTFGADQKFSGWQPWVGANPVTWVSASGPAVYYTSAYPTGAFVEIEDDAMPFDAAIAVNAPPPDLAVDGLGVLWPLAGRTVTLVDGNRDMGDRQVSATGALVGVQGEDLSSATLLAGLFTECRLQPFTPAGQQGVYAGQRQRRRNIVRAMATVQKHSGFILGSKIFPVDAFGEDAAAQPVLKSGSYKTRPIGRDYDPTIDLVKDRPGPMTVCELSMEVTP